MGSHIVDGKFQSDKYDWSKPGFVPLKVSDKMAQPVLWEYAQSRRAVDAEFADDLEQALRAEGFVPSNHEELATKAALKYREVLEQIRWILSSLRGRKSRTIIWENTCEEVRHVVEEALK